MEGERPLAFLKRKTQAGLSLLETLIATAVLLIVTVGLMSVAIVATSTTENQGHLSVRTTEYAQDKMEQLLALAWGDSTSDTTVFPAANSGGTGLAPGGSSDPSAPAAGYTDYLDASGNLLTTSGAAAPSKWVYKRVWQVSIPAGNANLKQVTVTTVVAANVGGKGVLPQSTVVGLKTNPF